MFENLLKIDILIKKKEKVIIEITSVLSNKINKFFDGATSTGIVFFPKEVPDKPCIVKTGIEKGEDFVGEKFLCCNKGSYGNMILCEGDDCKTGWFHYECAGVISPPKYGFYCRSCNSEF